MHEQTLIAKTIAILAHRGQVDKAGQPYIEHPSRVAAQFSAVAYVEQSVAWLHDVLEDTDVTPDDLLAAGIETRIVTDVVVLTHKDNEPNGDYWGRIRNRGGAARRVKLADIHDNANPRRLMLIEDDKTILRLVKKYGAALEALS